MKMTTIEMTENTFTSNIILTHLNVEFFLRLLIGHFYRMFYLYRLHSELF